MAHPCSVDRGLAHLAGPCSGAHAPVPPGQRPGPGLFHLIEPAVTVAGQCPMGCGPTLFVGAGGHITCSLLGCPRPSAVDELLEVRETEHLVHLEWTTFSVQHPLRERLDGALRDCDLHERIRGLDGPPRQPGTYRVTVRPGSPWLWEPVRSPAAPVDRYWLCGDDCTTDCGACKGAGRPAAQVDDPAAAVERVRALIDPETGMAAGNGYDGTRLFDEKDIRAALAGLRDDRAPLAGQHTTGEEADRG